VHITNTKSGKSVTVTVADECPTCENANSIDLSTGAFNMIGSSSDGVEPIEWEFV
jgi:rare lipoprotein A (peptidoglycan hydrolase)